ncbi:MAG: AzlD domain-containing protein [Chromatiaceae bacterium]|nr:AzlD domain-containing protein [Gammaproteobacteria bacterium]MCP5428008.1 AzlD domain-containing protein [Chromatiaceae bacterium]MCB1861150.1 AzlD domain-containing protein [Gammaproteobacteria bacterium]MCB1873863.1 AzlD domain-containing protein [Gammaproteobacteria bacterium]MCB1879368.1 AzlD domain-containing protein [Gammaproteobacteria bacterium]
MNDHTYLLLVILVMTAATFFTRATPFMLLHKRADHPLLLFLGRFTPPAIMTILVIYSLGSVEFSRYPYGGPELLAALLTLAVHLLWRQALLSIFAGTACYMYAVQSGLFI